MKWKNILRTTEQIELYADYYLFIIISQFLRWLIVIYRLLYYIKVASLE